MNKRYASRLTVLTLAAFAVFSPLSALAGETTARDSIMATLQNHPKLKAFQENREASTQDLKRARAGWLPRIDVRAGYGVEQFSDVTSRTSGKDHDWSDRSDAGVVLTQDIWDGLATNSRVDINKAKLESTEHRLYDNAEGLALDAVLAHLEVLRQRAIVNFSENYVKRHEEILGFQSERQRSGASSISDVTQTQGRLARAQSTLSENKSALEVAEANYMRLTGQRAPEAMTLPNLPESTPASFEAALGNSQSSNPKISAYKSDVQAARGEQSLAKASYQPRIYAELGPSYRNNVESAETDAWGTSAMLRMQWNVFNGGADYAASEGAAARVRQSRQELQNLLDALAEESRGTWSKYTAAQQLAKFYSSAVQYNSQTRDSYMQQFQVGQRSLLDVLDAENELFSSNIQLATAQANIVGAAHRLLALGGNLLNTMNVDRAELYKLPAEIAEK